MSPRCDCERLAFSQTCGPEVAVDLVAGLCQGSEVLRIVLGGKAVDEVPERSLADSPAWLVLITRCLRTSSTCRQRSTAEKGSKERVVREEGPSGSEKHPCQSRSIVERADRVGRLRDPGGHNNYSGEQSPEAVNQHNDERRTAPPGSNDPPDVLVPQPHSTDDMHLADEQRANDCPQGARERTVYYCLRRHYSVEGYTSGQFSLDAQAIEYRGTPSKSCSSMSPAWRQANRIGSTSIGSILILAAKREQDCQSSRRRQCKTVRGTK